MRASKIVNNYVASSGPSAFPFYMNNDIRRKTTQFVSMNQELQIAQGTS